MTTTIEVPDFWVLFNADGKAMQSTYSTINEEIRFVTAEEAWKYFTPNKRDRERDAAHGWQIAGIDQADWADYWSGRRSMEPVTWSESTAARHSSPPAANDRLRRGGRMAGS